MKGNLDIFSLQGRRCMAYLPPGGARGAAVAVLLCGPELSGQMEEMVNALEGASARPLALISCLDVDWDADYTPWPAEAPRGRCFAGRWEALLRFHADSLLPRARRAYGLAEGTDNCFIAGYSLGGLAALHGFLQSGLFSAAASVSGSLWYPRWREYLDSHPPRPGARVYLSLGRAEAKARSRLMGAVAENTEYTRAALSAALGAENVTFEWNDGGHFHQIPRRVARALAALAAP